MAYDIFDLQGTPNQVSIIKGALDRCTFPWEKLASKLYSTKGKRKIPVVWEDCDQFAAAQSLKAEDHGHDDHHEHTHDHEVGGEGHGDVFHSHVTDEDGNVLAHGIGFRSRILGLAWYSGKVSIDPSLEINPELAKEVFLSEGAHMIDFFYMTDAQRTAIFNAFHGGTSTPAEHGHDWFDKGDYYSWVGEAFMGGFVKAYSDLPVTIDFVHPPTAFTSKRIREELTPELVAPAPGGGGGTTPSFPQEYPYVSTKGSAYFHRKHKGIRPFITWESRDAAFAARKRPCSVCRP